MRQPKWLQLRTIRGFPHLNVVGLCQQGHMGESCEQKSPKEGEIAENDYPKLART